MILALLGCGGLGLNPLLHDSTEAGGVEALRVDDLDPAWGPPNRETEVTIHGAGFVAPVTVEFGNAAVDATWIDSGTVVATAPAAGVEVAVDVTVTSDGDSVTLPEGFTYSTEQPEDTGGGQDSDSGGGGQNAGKVGGLVQMNYVVYACPDCFGLTNPLQASSTVGFHNAVKGSWFDWLPVRGTCSTNTTPGTLASSYLEAGKNVKATSGSTVITMTPDADNVYSKDGLVQSDWKTGSAYTIEAAGGADLDAFEVKNAVLTPDGFDSFTPTALLATDLASGARININNATVGWSPRGDADVLVTVDIYTPAGSYKSSVTCFDTDVGSLTIPASYLQGNGSGSILVIGIFRYLLDEFERPDDGSSVETNVSYGLIGLGVIQ